MKRTIFALAVAITLSGCVDVPSGAPGIYPRETIVLKSASAKTVFLEKYCDNSNHVTVLFNANDAASMVIRPNAEECAG